MRFVIAISLLCFVSQSDVSQSAPTSCASNQGNCVKFENVLSSISSDHYQQPYYQHGNGHGYGHGHGHGHGHGNAYTHPTAVLNIEIPTYTTPRPTLPPPQFIIPRKHYKITVIRQNRPPTPPPPEPEIEQKTLIYVLVKKPDEPNDEIVIPENPLKIHPPEVYFIKYQQKQHKELTEPIEPVEDNESPPYKK